MTTKPIGIEYFPEIDGRMFHGRFFPEFSILFTLSNNVKSYQSWVMFYFNNLHYSSFRGKIVNVICQNLMNNEYEGKSQRSYKSALALLFQQFYSSIGVHMKVQPPIIKWGHGSLLSSKKRLSDRPKCKCLHKEAGQTTKYP